MVLENYFGAYFCAVEPSLSQEQAEVGGLDLIVGIQSHIGHQRCRTLTHTLDTRVIRIICVDFALHFDELAEPRNVVQRDGVAIEDVAIAALLDGGCWLEPQSLEDTGGRHSVTDDSFVFFTGFRRRLDEWAFVGEFRRFLAAFEVGLRSNTERLVGLGELAMWGIVVDVHLSDLVSVVGIASGQQLAEPSVVGTDLQFDFVHRLRWSGPGKTSPTPRGVRGLADRANLAFAAAVIGGPYCGGIGSNHDPDGALVFVAGRSAAWFGATVDRLVVLHHWIVAALGIVTLLSVIGFGVLLPGEVRMFREIVADDPDEKLTGDIGMRNAKLAGVQELLQLSIVFVMVNIRL